MPVRTCSGRQIEREAEHPREHRPKAHRRGRERWKGWRKANDTSQIPCIFSPRAPAEMERSADSSIRTDRTRTASSNPRPSKTRGKCVNKKAACCIRSSATLTGEPSRCHGHKLALAARKGEAIPRDHWVVDEEKGSCVRIHLCSFYIPQPERCPVPFWRLQRDPASSSRRSTTSSLRFRVGRWIGATTFFLKPKNIGVGFIKKPEVIDVLLRAKVGSSFNPKKLPTPDPSDTNDALESAAFLEPRHF